MVTWAGFEQSHRPAHDYRGFGTLTFARPDYDRALRDLVAALGGSC
ncbi:hypothetical protein ABZU76_26990 [Amycolatopsis sp. NPDC005232]